jgi:pimeloyl-ACP methyl ester carboxylesterase
MRVDIGDGTRLYFDVAGSALSIDAGEVRHKPTLLILHGGPGADHTSTRPWFDRFADIAQVVWYDQRGHGRSDGRDDPSKWTLDVWADDVTRFCAALDIVEPIVLGGSFGGMVAMRYAARHPSHPSKLVLLSTRGRRSIDRVVGAFRRLHGDEAAEIADAFWRDPDEETRRRYREVCLPLYTVSPDAMRSTSSSITNPDVLRHFIASEDQSMDLLPGLCGVACPTLVLAGRQDPVCPIEDATELVAALPAHLVQFEAFDSCGHGTYRDQPVATETVLREFFMRDASQ